MFDGFLSVIANVLGTALGIRAEEHEHSGRFALILGWSVLAVLGIGMVIILSTL